MSRLNQRVAALESFDGEGLSIGEAQDSLLREDEGERVNWSNVCLSPWTISRAPCAS